MYRNKKILAIVMARGGSRGIPMKNLQPVGGVPMVAKIGVLIRGIDEIDRAVITSDHPEIVQVARASHLDAPFERPPELSTDRVSDYATLMHALQATEQSDSVEYDVILMLQPTSPLRTEEHVRATYRKLIDEGRDAVWTVSETDSKNHPLKQLTFVDGRLGYYDERGREIVARQQLAPVYHRNGAAYAFTRECLLEQKTILGRNTSAVVLSEKMISIDTPEDLELANWYWEKKNS
jgi:CMP-N-acetylneuraminic acid synthetase